jgi:glycerol-3-phosphate dehydrogenase
VAERFDGRSHDWFCPSLAWNALTDKPVQSEFALALTPPRDGAPTYFVHPWKGRMFIGTGHSAWDGSLDNPLPTAEQMRLMIDDLNSAAPGLELGMENIVRIFAGLLPAAGPDSNKLSKRPVIVRHSDSGGPKGLYSICGVKFTTARLVAERTLALVLGGRSRRDAEAFPRPQAASDWSSRGIDFSTGQDRDAYLEGLVGIAEDESVVSLEDIVFRRTDLWETPELAMKLAPDLAARFGLNEHKAAGELERLASGLAGPALTETAVGY